MSRPRPSVFAVRSAAAAAAPLMLVVAVAVAGPTTACNGERKQQCAQFLSTIKPIDEPSPSSSSLDRMKGDLSAIHWQDQPLGIYAENYEHTLTVLSGTTKLKEGASAPDGTDDLLRTQLQKARTDEADLQRYCAQ